MMSKPSKGGPTSDSGPNDSSNFTTDDASFFQSSCLETLEDGKLVLKYATSENEKEPLHTGKWTDEEMAYVEGLIDEFKEGNLALPDGTSLRQFLAKMLNCSPKRISKRYEGNNYSKGRKFYVKSTKQLDPFDAQRRRAKLQALELRHKQKLLQLKIPHLLTANRPQDDQTDEEGTHEARNRKPSPVMTSEHGDPRDLVGGVSSAGVTGTGRMGAVGSAGLPASLRAVSRLSIDQAISAHNIHETLRSFPTAVDENQMSDLPERPRLNADFLAQLRSQQAETQRITRLLELQRLNNATGHFGQQQLNTRTSLLQRDLEPSSLLSNRLSALLGRSNQAQERHVGTTHQLQELLRAEEARAASRQGLAVPFAASLAASELIRPPSSISPFVASLVPSGLTAQLNRQSDYQANSLFEMQLQAQQMSSSQQLDPLLGLAQVQEHKINDEDYSDSNRQQVSSILASVSSQARSGVAQPMQLLAAPTSLLAERSLSSTILPPPTSAQPSPAELYASLQLRSLSPAASSQGTAARGQKRKASGEPNEEDQPINSGGISRSRFDDRDGSA